MNIVVVSFNTLNFKFSSCSKFPVDKILLQQIGDKNLHNSPARNSVHYDISSIYLSPLPFYMKAQNVIIDEVSNATEFGEKNVRCAACRRVYNVSKS